MTGSPFDLWPDFVDAARTLIDKGAWQSEQGLWRESHELLAEIVRCPRLQVLCWSRAESLESRVRA